MKPSPTNGQANTTPRRSLHLTGCHLTKLASCRGGARQKMSFHRRPPPPPLPGSWQRDAIPSKQISVTRSILNSAGEVWVEESRKSSLGEWWSYKRRMLSISTFQLLLCSKFYPIQSCFLKGWTICFKEYMVWPQISCFYFICNVAEGGQEEEHRTCPIVKYISKCIQTF